MKNLISAYISISGADDRDLGRQAIHLVVDEGYKIANVLPGKEKKNQFHGIFLNCFLLQLLSQLKFKCNCIFW